jgi:hypothetical protein
MSAMYRPPLVSFIAATTAKVDSPANAPELIGNSPITRPSTMPTMTDTLPA